jgi:hypothetical protein
MKKHIIIVVLALLCASVTAQTYSFLDRDALQYSQYSSLGTARFAAMGGAMGALGSNLSTLGTNPAGLAMYKHSEISITPELIIAKNKNKYLDPSWKEQSKTSFKISNFGAVLAKQIGASDSRTTFKYINFGITYSQVADFTGQSLSAGYTGVYDDENNNPTYLGALVIQANAIGNVDDDFYSGAAYDAGIIRFDTTTNKFKNNLYGTNGLYQKIATKSSGGIHEANFSLGANYGDIVYIGASLGVLDLSFNRLRTITETDEENLHPDFNRWTLKEDLGVKGVGVNFKAGIIVRPIDWLRLGFSIHTPTSYSMRENFETSVSGSGTYISNNVKGASANYRYNLSTPFKMMGSLGFVLGKSLVVGLEYEYLNYSQMKYSDDEDNYSSNNLFIKDNYKKGHIAKIGAEYRISPLSLRVGYNYYSTPSDLYQDVKQSVSGGLGLNFGQFYIDASYVASISGFEQTFYPDSYISKNKALKHNVFLTFGLKF